MPPQNPVDRTTVDACASGVELTYPHASVAVRPFRNRPIQPRAAARARSRKPRFATAAGHSEATDMGRGLVAVVRRGWGWVPLRFQPHLPQLQRWIGTRSLEPRRSEGSVPNASDFNPMLGSRTTDGPVHVERLSNVRCSYLRRLGIGPNRPSQRPQ